MVQPMVAKMVLPAFGGAPAVWNTCLVFFQGMLLLGYGYANRLPQKLAHRPLIVIHVSLFAIALILLFTSGLAAKPSLSPDPSMAPSLALSLFLIPAIGLPYLLVATGAPLLQRWYASAEDPYFLYAASNAGSMLGLIAYPFAVERLFSLHEQAKMWGFGFALLGCLVFLCGLKKPAEHRAEIPTSDPIPSWKKWRWFALSAVPSSLLMGATGYLTSNLASIPLLWIIPLALYLATFIVAFRRKGPPNSQKLFRYAALAMAPMVVMLVLEATDPLILLGLFHLVVFGLGSLACHSELAETKPSPDRLTEFYFIMSLGGVAGGVFNAMIAPAAFNGAYEYMIVLVALLLLRSERGPWKRLDLAGPAVVAGITLVICLLALYFNMIPGPLRTGLTIGLPAVIAFLLVDRARAYALALGGILLVAHFVGISYGWKLIASERSFFGVHRILESPTGKYRTLVHGVTIHGRQSFDRPTTPLTYYYPTGPIGELIAAMKERLPAMDAAMVGLGVGSLAAYARQTDHQTYFEIDPVVVKLARNPDYFTFVSASKGKIDVDLGDARLRIAQSPAKFDLIVLDAFSSDAVPVHLLTREAILLYLTKLKPGGILAFHVSNRYLSLRNVLATACDNLSLAARYGNDTSISEEEKALGKEPSQWFIIAKDAADLKVAPSHMFESITDIKRAPLWTDDRSNILDVWGDSEPQY